MSASPFKFLDAYQPEDRDRFFGRNLETDLLVADVVVSRLVVLFARTGTGKTSLINAGVRPRLHDRGYVTFLIRTREDPLASAREVLTQEARLPARGRFADQVRRLGRRLKGPVVLFFDQFEEFFLYLVPHDFEAALGFVSEIADLYDDRESGVHVVFSLREEWFVDMGLFRDRIPAIFHNDSNLRLRWFDRDQARDAIVGPAGEDCFGPELVQRLLEDLTAASLAVAGTPSPGDIEPAQLQIVCDTLWRARKGGPLTVADYEELGNPALPETIAQQILDRRLAEEFEGFKSREELQLVTLLLPELATPERTKRVREYDDLAASLLSIPGVTIDPELIHPTLERLRDAGLLDLIPRESGELVELTHDYLVQRLDGLLAAIALIWPKRLLAERLDEWRSSRRLIRSSVLNDVLVAVNQLTLDREAGELVLRSALGHAADVREIMPALTRSGAPVLAILEERMAHGLDPERLRAVEILCELATPDAFAILRRGLDVRDAAPYVVGVLGRTPSVPGISVLEEALRRPALVRDARIALAQIADDPARRDVAPRAKSMLLQSLTAAGTSTAVEALGTIDALVSVDLLDQIIGPGEPEPAARAALVWLAISSAQPRVRLHARRAIFKRVEAALAAADAPGTGAGPWCAELLEQIEDPAAARLLGRLADRPPIAERARVGLERLKESALSEVSAAAAKELDRLSGRVAPTPATRPAPSRSDVSPRPGRAEGLDAHYSTVLQQLANGRLVPFLGAGANVAVGSHEPVGGGRPPLARELAEYLARRFAFPEPDPPDLGRVAQYAKALTGEQQLLDELTAVLGGPFEPRPLHRFLASLPGRFRALGRPSLPAILTTNYDDTLERAFELAGEPFDLMTYIPGGDARGQFTYQPGGSGPPLDLRKFGGGSVSGGNTVIVKLHGGRDGYVVAEDDYIEFAARSADPAFLPTGLRAMLESTAFLFLGHSLSDWSIQILLRVLWRSTLAPSRYRSSAVTLTPSPATVVIWRERGVEIIDAPLDEYVAGLAQRLDAVDIAATPA